jgi:hypothetical protein
MYTLNLGASESFSQQRGLTVQKWWLENRRIEGAKVAGGETLKSIEFP